jgi:hypothetical protein
VNTPNPLQTVHHVGADHFIGAVRTTTWAGDIAWDVNESHPLHWAHHGQYANRADAEVVAAALAALVGGTP